MLAMEKALRTVGGRERGGFHLPQFVRSFSSPSLPAFSFSLLPSLPLPPKEFYFSLMVGVQKRLLVTPGAGLMALPPPRGHRVLWVPVLHRAPPVPERAPGAPDSGPGCSVSLQLQSLLM